MGTDYFDHTTEPQQAIVIQPHVRSWRLPREADVMLEEAIGLAAAISLDVVHAETIALPAPHAPTFLRSGQVERLTEFAGDYDHPIMIINTSLSPVQQRNLEMRLKAKVIDRTALILEIFGARAKTHAGRLQVELAAMMFQRSRLVRSWTHLERQRGGGGFLGGPGERQIELDRRMLMDRVVRIKAELKDVERTRALQRQNRNRQQTPTIALVGYTNAGKSTLFNAITGAGVLSKDMLFATLDPTMRHMALPSGKDVVLADTVGFISQLPTELIEAFKSTLEEVVQADILLHVHDGSSPVLFEEAADVRQVLLDIGFDEARLAHDVIHVINKKDNMSEDMMTAVGHEFEDAIFTSALTSDGVPDLVTEIEGMLLANRHLLEVELPPQAGAARAWLYERGEVQGDTYDDTGLQTLKVRLDEADEARFEKQFPDVRFKTYL
ncbi:MAG: GTPase HflX [Candidatus Puniceispirillaceae bacterium]